MSREKEWVKQRYGAIASQAARACCPDAAAESQQPCCAEVVTCCSTNLTASDLEGVVTSVHIAGRKPNHAGDPS